MKKYIIANWKSQKNTAQVANWFQQFPKDKASKNLLQIFELIIAVPYPLIPLAQSSIEERQLPIKLAAQDLSAFGPGAFTGEVCPENLEAMSVEYAILGHSERRRFLKESSQLIADKIKEASRGKIKAILCVDRPYWQEQARLLASADLENSLLAYEPASAIGSGRAESVEELSLVKQELQEIYSASMPFIYGGSVNAGNVEDYLTLCDGAIIGTASLDALEFVDLLYHASKAVKE